MRTYATVTRATIPPVAAAAFRGHARSAAQPFEREAGIMSECDAIWPKLTRPFTIYI